MSKVETLACPDDELGHEEEINKHDKEELESDEEVFLNESQLENSVLKNNQNEELFFNHSPPWGGKIVPINAILDSCKFANYTISNTCSFDYLLYALWLSYKQSIKVI
jgi:hypothetical protein